MSEGIVFLNPLSSFFYGVFGGILAELIGWFKLRTILCNGYPEYAKSWSYWFITIVMILAGGVLVIAYVQSGFEFKPILAINVGASAPLMIETFTRQLPALTPGKTN